MSNLEQAARMALEALQLCANGTDDTMLTRDALSALLQALEQPVQEPVAWMYSNAKGRPILVESNLLLPFVEGIPLYREPPKREWVGLDKNVILNIHAKKCWPRTQFADKKYGIALDTVTVIDFVHAIESALKEKNI